jgi:hypothetical protein
MNNLSPSRRSTRWLRCLIVLALLSVAVAPVALPAQPAAADPPTSFVEEFDTATLDPAWQVVEFTGPRVYGFTSPANHISLTENPGHLRYYLDPMTHYDGFLNNYQTTYGWYSCCNHDPGLELHRQFGGDAWTLDVKASYYMPFSNGRNQDVRIYFGDGGPGTFWLDMMRWRDGPWPAGTPETQPVLFLLRHQTGSALADVETLEAVYGLPSPSDTFYFQTERNGGVLTARWSIDGSVWTTAFTHDLETQLDGLEQRVVVTGLSWFTPAGSYADYDYIRLQPMNEPPDCSLAYPSVTALWPANHKFAPIDVLGVTDPDSDEVSITVTGIWQDEPVDSYGDGRFTPDGMGTGTSTAQVRAERAGTPRVPGNGRVYHISFSADDGYGGVCMGEVRVAVPHDQNKPAVDDGALYDSTLLAP